MKRITFLIMFVTMAVFATAQTDHLTFMGIPLDGTITQFQAKLAKKGIKYDEVLSKYISAPCRVFHGLFAGEESNVYVYYNERSKIVYRAKAVMNINGLIRAEKQYSDFKKMLGDKYYLVGEDKDSQFIHDCIFVKDAFFKYVGSVGLYISKNDIGYEEYSLHVDYVDGVNSEKDEDIRKDDL